MNCQLFDFFCISTNEILGSVVLFIIISLIIINFILAKSQVNYRDIIIINTIWLLIIWAKTYDITVLVYVLVVIGCIYGYMIAKMIER